MIPAIVALRGTGLVVSDAMPSNDELFARARRVIPGGVNSPVRAFRAVGGTPYFVDRAEGDRAPLYTYRMR